jgi:hypothetical protein
LFINPKEPYVCEDSNPDATVNCQRRDRQIARARYANFPVNILLIQLRPHHSRRYPDLRLIEAAVDPSIFRSLDPPRL